MLDRNTIFQNEIGDDWTICQNCFRRTHDVEEIDPRDQRESTRGVVDQLVSKTKAAETIYTEEGKKTACECGSVDRTPSKHTLKKDTAAEYADNLEKRLREEGYSVPPMKLRGIVKELKSEGCHHGPDNRVFDIAVEKAFNSKNDDEEPPN